jgi:predicted deacylase
MLIYASQMASGLLTDEAEAEGKIAIGGEFGFGESVNRRGVLHARIGIQNVLRHYGMLSGDIVRIDPARPHPPVLVDARDLEDYIPCPQDGVWEPLVDLGEEVREGQLIGRIHSFSDHAAAPSEIRAHRDGFLIMMCGTAQCRQGTTLFVIARRAEPAE